MERLIEMMAVLGLLYAGYALGMKKWNYSSRTQLEKRRAQLKEAGMTNTFYFIHATTLFVLTLISGGTFTLFWLYQQWKAVLRGFKRADGSTLAYGPFARTLGGAVTFFTLGGIINRTCEYMHKTPAWPAAVWGALWLGGLAAALAPWDLSARIAGYILFCYAPTAFQRKLNVLPKIALPRAPKTAELAAALAGGLLCGALAALRHFL